MSNIITRNYYWIIIARKNNHSINKIYLNFGNNRISGYYNRTFHAIKTFHQVWYQLEFDRIRIFYYYN